METASSSLHPHGISERPADADARSRLGNWEADTVVGSGATCRGSG